jgi:hypothetical protein
MLAPEQPTKSLDLGSRFGTLAWLFERYRRSHAFERISDSRPKHHRALPRFKDIGTKLGGRVRALLVASISPAAADRIYSKLQMGPRGKDASGWPEVKLRSNAGGNRSDECRYASVAVRHGPFIKTL